MGSIDLFSMVKATTAKYIGHIGKKKENVFYLPKQQQNKKVKGKKCYNILFGVIKCSKGKQYSIRLIILNCCETELINRIHED